MKQFEEFERSQMMARIKKDSQHLKCTKCNGTWLHALRVSRFDANTASSIGQMPSAEGSFIILKCAKCGTHNAPRLNRHHSSEEKLYDEMLKDLNEDPIKSEPEEQKEVGE